MPMPFSTKRRSFSPVSGMDRILATILFTDIVGSADRAAVLGDHHRRDLLESCQGIMHREAGRFRGHEVDRSG
jgi:class 3 adenylate cyclase